MTMWTEADEHEFQIKLKEKKMNANELADACMGSKPWLADEDVMMQAATMLRQQQLEIEAMRKDYFILAGKYQEALLELKFGKAQE